MAFVFAVGLIVLSAALLGVGLLTSSSWAYLLSAVFSAMAVGYLWARVSKRDRKPVLRNLPAAQAPDWERPVEKRPPREPLDPDRSMLPPVAIDDYENLLASEIVPSLETLSVEQLRAVIERERYGLKRPTIISRAEKLIDLTVGSAREPITAESRSVDLRSEGQLVGRRAPKAPRRPPTREVDTARPHKSKDGSDISLS